MPRLYNAIMFAFPASAVSRETVCSVLLQSLSRLINELPFLGADIVSDRSIDTRPGNLRLQIPDQAVPEIVVRDLTFDINWHHSYEQLRSAGMPLKLLDGKILAPPASGIGNANRFISAQLNCMKGGYILSLCSNHAFVDASGLATIMSRWAQFAYDLQHDSSGMTRGEVALYEDQLPALHPEMTSPAIFERLKSRPEVWHVLGLDATKNLSPQETTQENELPTMIPANGPMPNNLRTAIFEVTSTAAKRLKDDISPSKPSWISSQDALHALIWCSIIKARFPASLGNSWKDHGTSILSVAIDGRSLLTPPIPASYIGNAIFFALVEANVDALTASKASLSEIALLIRRRIEECKDKSLITDAVRLAATIPDVRDLRIVMQDYLGVHLSTSSLVNLPFYELEFGGIFGNGGKPEFFRFPKGQFGAICLLLPRKLDGRIEVVIGMNDADMDRLINDEQFRKYVTFLSE